MKFKQLIPVVFFMKTALIFAQSTPPDNWFNLDPNKDKVPGISTEKTYAELLKGKTSQTVVVAVIDSGVDPEHEDLKDVMWTNTGEIPDNGIDDDKNGFVDDIYGWNFIGGKNGQNVQYDAFELTRVYAKLKPKYEKAERKTLNKKEKKEYDTYIETKNIVEKKLNESKQVLEESQATEEIIYKSLDAVSLKLGNKNPSEDNIAKLETGDNELLNIAKNYLLELIKAGAQFETLDDLKKQIKEAYAENNLDAKVDVDYHYNINYDPRKTIIGDDYSNSYQRNYGNNDVKGTDAMHGTHVAGIIGANRKNNIGIKGVADNVKIMSVRVVPPDGDERDKDVANAIIYAVDNGAKVINMSFGKGYSWDKEAVDKAVRYAAKKDVLLVQAAGNAAQDNDVAKNFPTPKFEKRGGWFKPKKAKNWITVGAVSWKGGENLAAPFSNFGKKTVDVFSPGVAINSTLPDNQYGALSGTSMASPVTAGLAALIRSYYPALTAEQVKEAITNSITENNSTVYKPSEDRSTNTKVNFKDLSINGGEINVYKAIDYASKMKGKNKVIKVVVP